MSQGYMVVATEHKVLVVLIRDRSFVGQDLSGHIDPFDLR
jgi:hypothetical protein